MIQLAVPSHYPPGKTWLNYLSTGVGLQSLAAGLEEIQQTKRDEIWTNTIAMWSGKPTKPIFINYPSEMYMILKWMQKNTSEMLGGWYL